VASSDPAAAGREDRLVVDGFGGFVARRRVVVPPDVVAEDLDVAVEPVRVVDALGLAAEVVRADAVRPAVPDFEREGADDFGAAGFGTAVFGAVVAAAAAAGFAVDAVRDRVVADFGVADDAFGTVEAGDFAAVVRVLAGVALTPDALVVVVRRVAGFAVPAVAAERFRVRTVAAGFAAGVAAAAGFGRLREPGGRPRRRGAVAAVAAAGAAFVVPPAASECRIGVRTWLACTAAVPTVRDARPTAPPTAPAADEPAETAVDAADEPAEAAVDAAAAAREATLDPRAATSDSDSANCRRRFATSFLPLPATALASCFTRLDSILRAAASFFSTFRSSLAALFGSGVTTPLASTTTSATVSTTTSRRPLLPPSSRFAIDHPPACRSHPFPLATAGPLQGSACGRRQVCHLGRSPGGRCMAPSRRSRPRFTSR
jgi:hypothetical protein